MSESALGARIEIIERGYEYLLAYAAQGRQDDKGTELRSTLTSMHEAIRAIGAHIDAAFAEAAGDPGIAIYLRAVARDLEVAGGAVALVLSREHIASLLIDNLNASVHLRALLTDLFLLEQAGRAAPLPR